MDPEKTADLGFSDCETRSIYKFEVLRNLAQNLGISKASILLQNEISGARGVENEKCHLGVSRSNHGRNVQNQSSTSSFQREKREKS